MNTSGIRVAFADITKAFDNVDLDKLNRIILEMNPPDEIRLELEDELRDLRTLNTDMSCMYQK